MKKLHNITAENWAKDAQIVLVQQDSVDVIVLMSRGHQITPLNGTHKIVVDGFVLDVSVYAHDQLTTKLHYALQFLKAL